MLKTLKALAIALLAAGTTAALAHGDDHKAKAHHFDASKVEHTAFGREGNPRKVSLMKKFPEMEHADPNMAHVKPGATGEIV
jgi:uncharacterized cupredoxin-like copper-binding protein